MSSELPPAGDLIKQSTEALSTFVRWVAELIVAKNWFTLLILLAIANLFLFKLEGGIALQGIKSLFGITSVPTWYSPLFWIVEGGLVLGALAIAIRTMPKTAQSVSVKIPDYKAIKGLRPFTQDDAEVFSQLQRQGNLRECINSVTSPSFRFGILHGVSGCGKTSFLQAGLLPRLSIKETTHRGIYVRLGGQDPVRAIASALSIALEIPSEWLLSDTSSAGFRKLLDTAVNAAEQPLVLFLDQFEQFFVYYPREEQRQPFVAALTDWYTEPHPLPVSFVIAVRSDLLYQLDELHKALGYALAPQEVFRLEKFTPTETTNVLRAIAQLENLSFDARFITELADAELADRDDGRISPVDVQILAWMIEQQPQGELRAFDRNAFQKFGGVEGLLQRFLERTLEARMLPKQRESALKVLLALTDLDRQVRAGVLTKIELTTKLKDTLSADEVTEATQWLARGDVRLVTPQEREGVVGYELAHERLIPALLRQTQKELTDVERARQLLDRRVNEWLGNQRDKRYCFSFKELWLIRKQRPYLDWGIKREQKEKLIRLSQRRVYGTIAAFILLISTVSGFAGWLRFTPSGQFQGMQWQLNSQLANASADAVASAAVAFAKNDQWSKAFDLTQTYLQPKNISPSPSQDAAMSTFARGAADALIKNTPLQAMQPAGEMQLARLKRLTESAQAIQDDSSKSSALRAIATAYAQLDDATKAAEVLKQSLSTAQAIQDDRSKSSALSAIATAAAQLDDATKAAEVLKLSLTTAQAIQDDRSKSSALRAIATAYAQLDDATKAAEVLKLSLTTAQAIQDDSYKSSALSAIASAYAQLDDATKAAEVLKLSLTIAQDIQDDFSKSNALSAIATAAAQLDDATKAAEVLKLSLATAQDIQVDSSKSDALRVIATAYAQLDDATKAAEVLKLSLTTAQAIQDDSFKSYALSDIASAAAQLDDATKAAEVLKLSLTTAQAIQDDGFKSYALSAIATASWALADMQMQKELLGEVLGAAQRGRNSSVVREMAAIHAKRGEWNQALNSLRGYGNEETFSQLLTIRAENKNPALITGAVVLKAPVSGNPGNYTLEATLQSPDQNCDQRVSWWEVITPDGKLLARQMLDTVHRDQQPFTSQLSSINIAADQQILIRAYFQGEYEYGSARGQSLSGYTDQALRGSIKNGFKPIRLSPSFARWLEKADPQPGKCVE